MASPLSAPQPRSTPAITAVSSGSKVCKKFNLLCAELRVVLGSGLALALGANTDVHTRRSWLCRSAVGFGALSGKLTSLLSLCGAGTLPAPAGRNQRHSGAELKEHLPSLLPFCAKEGLPGLQRRRLCLPSQIRVGGGGSWGALWVPSHASSLQVIRSSVQDSSAPCMLRYCVSIPRPPCVSGSLCFCVCLRVPGSMHLG